MEMLRPDEPKDPVVREARAAIAGRITVRFAPEQGILFGSHARRDERPDSDLDLLVVLRSAEPKYKLMVALHLVVGAVGVPKDLLVLLRKRSSGGEACRGPFSIRRRTKGAWSTDVPPDRGDVEVDAL